ncbi:uncharacterized protein SPSK_08179 [Sporothrix schenckii 1099-18]|uniref:Uncharacterized protein n=1 Tax=Sporothrix schenckii 1099-18 TaxID=1397361 RepID=A0A0F2MEU4_SPOSC|nr:uncharacterized protein SPSK_08179 [Sporothrix schenckii 1099-18]KJR88152.1 hypothetical protein SPSK_08179 [Sporothrix schenckii 1099-18]
MPGVVVLIQGAITCTTGSKSTSICRKATHDCSNGAQSMSLTLDDTPYRTLQKHLRCYTLDGSARHRETLCRGVEPYDARPAPGVEAQFALSPMERVR